MAGIIFSKTGNTYSPVNFNRGRTLDSGGYYEPKQITTETGSGNIQTCDLGVATQYITCDIQNIAPEVYAQLVNFLKDETVRWRGKSFTFTDEDEVNHTVHYWGEQLKETPMKSGNINIQSLLRVV